MNDYTIGAQRLLDDIEKTAGQGMAAIPKLPGLAGNLARVILSQARAIDELRELVAELKSHQGHQGQTIEDCPQCQNRRTPP